MNPRNKICRRKRRTKRINREKEDIKEEEGQNEEEEAGKEERNKSPNIQISGSLKYVCVAGRDSSRIMTEILPYLMKTISL